MMRLCRRRCKSADAIGVKRKWELFCDLDGVLCDFDIAVRRLTGKGPDELKKKEMWPAIAKVGNGDMKKGFYATLPWMKDGEELWDNIKHMDPTILTGVPLGHWAPPQKKIWCATHLTKGTHVITCMARDKHKQSHKRAVLIDDREDLGEMWEAKGGVFVHHTSTASSVAKLRQLGITAPKAVTEHWDRMREQVERRTQDAALLQSTPTKAKPVHGERKTATKGPKPAQPRNRSDARPVRPEQAEKADLPMSVKPLTIRGPHRSREPSVKPLIGSRKKDVSAKIDSVSASRKRLRHFEVSSSADFDGSASSSAMDRTSILEENALKKRESKRGKRKRRLASLEPPVLDVRENGEGEPISADKRRKKDSSGPREGAKRGTKRRATSSPHEVANGSKKGRQSRARVVDSYVPDSRTSESPARAGARRSPQQPRKRRKNGTKQKVPVVAHTAAQFPAHSNSFAVLGEDIDLSETASKRAPQRMGTSR